MIASSELIWVSFEDTSGRKETDREADQHERHADRKADVDARDCCAVLTVEDELHGFDSE